MSGQEHTAECGKRLEDVMTTDASSPTRVKAACVKQAERITRISNDPGVANPSSSSGSGQHKRVRFADQEHPDPIPERDTEMRTGSQEAPEKLMQNALKKRQQVQRLIPKDALHCNAKPRVNSMILVILRRMIP